MNLKSTRVGLAIWNTTLCVFALGAGGFSSCMADEVGFYSQQKRIASPTTTAREALKVVQQHFEANTLKVDNDYFFLYGCAVGQITTPTVVLQMTGPLKWKVYRAFPSLPNTPDALIWRGPPGEFDALEWGGAVAVVPKALRFLRIVGSGSNRRWDSSEGWREIDGNMDKVGSTSGQYFAYENPEVLFYQWVRRVGGQWILGGLGIGVKDHSNGCPAPPTQDLLASVLASPVVRDKPFVPTLRFDTSRLPEQYLGSWHGTGRTGQFGVELLIDVTSSGSKGMPVGKYQMRIPDTNQVCEGILLLDEVSELNATLREIVESGPCSAGVHRISLEPKSILAWSWRMTNSQSWSGNARLNGVGSAVGSSAPRNDAPSTTPGYVGVWRGDVTQGDQKYGVVMQITNTELGATIGEARYSKPLSCVGVLTLESREGDTLLAKESVRQSRTCASDYVRISPSRPGAVMVKWYWPKLDGAPVATAELQRIQ